MPTVLLQGTGQVGKTTLAKQLIQTSVLQHYFSFDDPVLLSAATQDPVGFCVSYYRVPCWMRCSGFCQCYQPSSGASTRSDWQTTCC
jgi:GTPase SAR1 family protein